MWLLWRSSASLLDAGECRAALSNAADLENSVSSESRLSWFTPYSIEMTDTVLFTPYLYLPALPTEVYTVVQRREHCINPDRPACSCDPPGFKPVMSGIVSTRKSGDVHRLGMIQWPIPAEISAPPVAQPGGPINAQSRAKTPKAHSEPPTISWSWPPISVQNRHLWYFVTDGIFAILALSTLSSGA